MAYQDKRTVYICSNKYKNLIVEYKNNRNRLNRFHKWFMNIIQLNMVWIK